MILSTGQATPSDPISTPAVPNLRSMMSHINELQKTFEETMNIILASVSKLENSNVDEKKNSGRKPNPGSIPTS